MNRDQFITYLHTPDQLNGKTVDFLSKLVDEFPYCQTLQLLYLKNLQNHPK